MYNTKERIIAHVYTYMIMIINSEERKRDYSAITNASIIPIIVPWTLINYFCGFPFYAHGENSSRKRVDERLRSTSNAT